MDYFSRKSRKLHGDLNFTFDKRESEVNFEFFAQIALHHNRPNHTKKITKFTMEIMSNLATSTYLAADMHTTTTLR
jgi:hypothetical protein